MSARGRLARLLVGLYPLAWQRRYGAELLALLEQRPPHARDLADLLRGVARAHIRPLAALEELVTPAERLRNTATGVALCWGVVVLAGAGFAKETEDPALATGGQTPAVLGALRDSITAIAIVAAVIVALAGAPLLWSVTSRAWRERRHDVLWRLSVAPAVLTGFVAVTAGLLLWLNHQPASSPGSSSPRLIGAIWQLLALATGLTCAYAPRLVLERVPAPEALLRRAVAGAVALMVCMFALAAATAAYGVELVMRAPALAAQSGGPLWPTSGEAVLGAAVAMAAAATVAALSCQRGRRALVRR